MYLPLLPWYFPVYETWYLRLSRLPESYFYPELWYLLALSSIHINLIIFPPLVTLMQNYLIMRWGQGVPGTHQLHSNLKIVFIILFHTPLPYQFIQRFHILGIMDSSPPQLGTLVRPYYSYISLLYASTILPSSLVSGGGMSAPQFWSEIFSWWITVSFSSNTINIIILPYVFLVSLAFLWW